MSRLILHIGPGKCGSTSIQNLFAQHTQPCAERTFFYLLKPSDFTDLETDAVDDARTARLDALLTDAVSKANIVILSHEFLFQTPKAMGIITERARLIFDDVRIIGYVRPQSSLFRSSYSQWLFRVPDRLAEVSSVLQSQGLKPHMFTGIERQFIASMLDKYHSARQLSGYRLLDLWEGYSAIETACGLKPMVGSLTGKDRSLLADFCEKAGLSLRSDITEQRANTAFHPHVVEGVTAAIVAGHDVMGPHEGNEKLITLSKGQPKYLDFNDSFMRVLSTHIDNDFKAANKTLCNHYDLDFYSVFGANTTLGTDPSLLAFIEAEQTSRLANPVPLTDYYAKIAESFSRHNA